MNSIHKIFIRDGRALALVLASGLALSGCNPDIPAAPSIPTSELFGSLQILPQGSMIQRGTTLTLTVSPRTITGQEIPLTDGTVTFSSADRSRVTVDENGTVTGVQQTSTPVRIIVSMTKQNVTQLDTAFVFVTDASAAPTSLAVLPQDSTRIPLLGFTRVRAVLSVGATMLPSAYAYFYSSNPMFLKVDPITGELTTGRAGQQVWIHAVTNAYGTPLRDSVLYTTLESPFEFLMISAGQGGEITSNLNNVSSFVQPCAAVMISNSSQSPVSVTIGPADAPACNPTDNPANIDSLPVGGIVSKSFRNPGTYAWRVRALDGSSPAALTGKFIVR